MFGQKLNHPLQQLLNIYVFRPIKERSLSVTDIMELARAYAEIASSTKGRQSCFKNLRDETLEYLAMVEKDSTKLKIGNADRVKENADLRQEIDELKKENAGMTQENTELNIKIDELKKRNADKIQENTDRKIKIEELMKARADCKKENAVQKRKR